MMNIDHNIDDDDDDELNQPSIIYYFHPIFSPEPQAAGVY